ncbi:MAG: helix-turn-helix domain-containing protein [Luteibacter sp.]
MPPVSADDPTVTTRDAAQLLGVSVSTAQKWIEAGAIPSWKTPGGHRRMRRSGVLALLEERMAPPGESATTLPDELRAARQPDYPVPVDEARRLRAVARCGLLDTAQDPAFDRITWLACRLTGASISTLALLTARRQWFKSRQGLASEQTPRSQAFCSHTILGPDLMMVEDARRDDRFRDNPLVTGEPHIRFYAGHPVRSPDGQVLGTLCVFDDEVRSLSSMQVNGLRALAAIAEDEIRLHMIEHGRRWHQTPGDTQGS